jgi:ParB family chromosome partitioning protein
VLDGEIATEISLAENEMRQAMHPADQFEAFKKLADEGKGPEEIAARFGVTVKVVQQRMKLAMISRKLFALYRKGDMNLDQLMAFTVSDDHAAQEAAWSEGSDWQRSAHAIRQRLTAAHVADSDKRVQFVTVDAYAAAGGSVITDLFQTKRYLADPVLLDRLVNEKPGHEAEVVRAEGWKWVEIMQKIDWDTRRGFEELRGKRLPLAPKKAKELAKLQRERDSMSDQHDRTEDELERCEQLDAEIEALEESAVVFSDRQKARAGAYLSIGSNGMLDVVRGLVRTGDIKAKKKEDGDETGDTGTTAAAPGLSRTLTDDLTAHRTAALRARLAQEPHVAFASIVHVRCKRRSTTTATRLRSRSTPRSLHSMPKVSRTARHLGDRHSRTAGGAVGLVARARHRHALRPARPLCRLHGEAGTRHRRRPPCRCGVARHEGVLATDRELFRMGAETAHP